MGSRRYVFGPRPRGKVGEWTGEEAQPVGESGGVTYGKTVTLGATDGPQTDESAPTAPEDPAGR